MVESYHYMIDLFYRETGRSEAVCKNSMRARARTNEGAIREAEAVYWRRPSYYEVRRVALSGDEVIFKSPVA